MLLLNNFTRVARISAAGKPARHSRRLHKPNVSRLRLMAVAYDEDFEPSSYASEKKKGLVKWFDPKKGYGFIEAEDGTGDIFVHQTNIICSGYRALRDGEQVEFVVDDSEDGRLKAVQVTGPDGSEPMGANMPDPYNEIRGGERSGDTIMRSSEPDTELGRFSSGLQIVVHNLPWSVSSDRLTDFYAEFGAVEADIQYDEMGRSRGYGIVKFERQEDAQKAIENTHMSDLDGRNILVRFDRYG